MGKKDEAQQLKEENRDKGSHMRYVENKAFVPPLMPNQLF